jgi:hypothetical protein
MRKTRREEFVKSDRGDRKYIQIKNPPVMEGSLFLKFSLPLGETSLRRAGIKIEALES